MMESLGSLQSLTLALGAILFCAFVIFAFVRGWIFVSSQVIALLKQSEQRGADYKQLYEEEREQKLLVLRQLDKQTVIGETMTKILNALPTPNSGDNTSGGST